MSLTYTRRDIFGMIGATAAASRGPRLFAASGKPMRGAFIIMATPYTDAKKIDHEDLAGEVDFLHRCGVQGMVWPQLASEYPNLKKEERFEGMETLVKAAKGKKPALVLGVQAPNIDEMIEVARYAEKLQPDAVIAMPPKEAKSLDDYRAYYGALCKLAKRPVFIQTTGGAEGIEPTVEFIIEMATKYPNFGYVKEEHNPVLERLIAMAKHRPSPIKSLFGGAAGKAWPYEMRHGFDGTMPGAMYSDIYAQLWELHEQGKRDDVRDLFAKLLLVINLDAHIPGVRNYIFKRRGIFKTSKSRRGDHTWSEEAVAEIEHNLAALAPHFRVRLPA
ncbi:MAG: dihydrodipicolinate synthase family protein [Acidobacteria bacterium]|nr:dihydrodipicolinate synthase family protein [Acidobacteriota bacterium]